MYNEMIALRNARLAMPAMLRGIEYSSDVDLSQFIEELEGLAAFLPQIQAEKMKRRSALPYPGFGEYQDAGTPQHILLERLHESETRIHAQ